MLLLKKPLIENVCKEKKRKKKFYDDCNFKERISMTMYSNL